MTPTFKLIARVKKEDGTTVEEKNITESILPHLLSLTITDNAGFQVDNLTLVLADTARATVIPEPDTILSISLGYMEGGRPRLREMGEYALDEVKWSDPPPQFTLTARTAVHSDQGTPADLPPMQTKKSRSWEVNTKLADMVAKIADEHAMKPFVGRSLQKVILPHLDQTDETDLNFLQRVVADRGGWVKLAYGHIATVTAADAQAAAKAPASPTAPPPLTIRPGSYTSLDWTNKKRSTFTRVIATWRDTDGATDREVVIGDLNPEAPTDRLRTPYPDEATAIAAARARLDAILRDGKTLNVTLPAPANMSPSADAPVVVAGIASQIDGTWMPKTVTWNLSRSGLSVSIQCETSG
ncbi:hypothetical protein Ga0100231_024200 [Opitutaceae bacterium TAV4]|nr:hypothetical protein Ga0100231_024200 [Opitutaceae bacterium TAV4]RRK00814.1 hypothetical protein Ga0100230_023775 [Opitutaceae bacterium TAV3]